jgi:hypothetical protein
MAVLAAVALATPELADDQLRPALVIENGRAHARPLHVGHADGRVARVAVCDEQDPVEGEDGAGLGGLVAVEQEGIPFLHAVLLVAVFEDDEHDRSSPMATGCGGRAREVG